MLKKLFEDKKFIFIFTFLVEFIFYYFFEYLLIGGEYILPDIGLGPVFGLMFGPVGALGQASASFVFEIFSGVDPLSSFLDFSIMFLISILTYKLWYSIFGKWEITTPKFDSIHNIFKFISIIFLISIYYWIVINIVLEMYAPFYQVYPLKSQINIIAYIFNMFDFSMLFGFLFISAFNILKIPLQRPKKWSYIMDVDYKYFLLIFIVFFGYTLLTSVFNFDNDFLDMIFFILTVFTSILLYLNKSDDVVNVKKSNYSLIEEIILIFLVILAITLYVLFDSFHIFTSLILVNLNSNYSLIITFAFTSFLVVLLLFIHIYFVENNITNPIYELINVVTNYGENHQIENEQNFKSKFKDYLNDDDDISKLISSFITLNKNININLNKIKQATAERKKIETEFNIASNIQSHMLKTNFDEFSSGRPFEIYGYMGSARKVGGDFYDFFDIDEDNIAFLVGDVRDWGVPATFFMVKTMHSIRTQFKFNSNPSQFYENINNITCDRNDSNLFVSSLFGKLNLKTGNVVFVNAGHNRPLIRNHDNDFDYFDLPSNLVLGLIEDFKYEEFDLQLNPGDIIFLYTNGITEANVNFDEFYGEARLKEILNKYKDENLEIIIEKIRQDLDDFYDGVHQFDDVTMLIIKYLGENNE